MLIADENIPIEIIIKLREENFETFSVFESKRGISDKQIIEFAQNQPKIIVTEDKDFVDLVFAYNQKEVTVILLHYHYLEMKIITNIIINFLKNNIIQPHTFIVITTKNIRIRKVV